MKPSLGLLLLMLFALVAGCGGNDEGRNGGTSTATTQATTSPTTKVERYLRENFGGTRSSTKAEWYDHVVKVSVSGTATTVRTDLPADRAGRRQARQICEAVRGTIPGLTDEVHVTGLAARNDYARCVP